MQGDPLGLPPFLPAEKGKMLGKNGVGLFQEDNPFHGIAQFAHISGPGMGKDSLFGLWGDPGEPLLELFIVPAHKKSEESENILFSVPQRRMDNSDHVETEIKVFPKIPFLHFRFQIFIRRRNETDIRLLLFHSPQL